MVQTLKHKREPYESELTEEVAREYSRQQAEKKCSPPDHGRDIEELGMRMNDMEESLSRVASTLETSNKRLETVFNLLIARKGTADNTAVHDSQALKVVEIHGMSSSIREPSAMSLDGGKEAEQRAAEHEVEGVPEEVKRDGPKEEATGVPEEVEREGPREEATGVPQEIGSEVVREEQDTVENVGKEPEPKAVEADKASETSLLMADGLAYGRWPFPFAPTNEVEQPDQVL